MTVEDHLARWALQDPTCIVTAAERAFIEDMRHYAAQGVGYGWMQQIVEWEWQSKGPGAWGPEYFEKVIARMSARSVPERDNFDPDGAW